MVMLVMRLVTNAFKDMLRSMRDEIEAHEQ
jgi:hypothetical protein